MQDTAPVIFFPRPLLFDEFGFVQNDDGFSESIAIRNLESQDF